MTYPSLENDDHCQPHPHFFRSDTNCNLLNCLMHFSNHVHWTKTTRLGVTLEIHCRVATKLHLQFVSTQINSSRQLNSWKSFWLSTRKYCHANCVLRSWN